MGEEPFHEEIEKSKVSSQVLLTFCMLSYDLSIV